MRLALKMNTNYQPYARFVLFISGVVECVLCVCAGVQMFCKHSFVFINFDKFKMEMAMNYNLNGAQMAKLIIAQQGCCHQLNKEVTCSKQHQLMPS